MEENRPLLRGTAFALGAALAFGLTTPLLARSTIGVGALAAGGLLYLGASLGSTLLTLAAGRPFSAGLLRRPQIGRLLLVALLGGAVTLTELL